MEEQRQTQEHKTQKEKPAKVSGDTVFEQEGERVDLVSMESLLAAGDDPSVQKQAGRLGDPRFLTAQRHEIARQINLTQGNTHLQRVVSQLPLFNDAGQQIPSTPTTLQMDPDHDVTTPEGLGTGTGADPEAVSARVEAMLDRNGGQGWHLTLPRSGIHAGRITFIGGGRRRPPRLGGGYPVRPAVEAVENPVEEEARRVLIDGIRSRLSSIAVPTASGQLGTLHGGYAYGARAYAGGSPASAAHQDYMETTALDGLGLDSTNPRISGFWTLFHFVITHEGDTAAINAWDQQILTVGAGFAQTASRGRLETGTAGAVYSRMPAAFHQNLYQHGIFVNENNTFTVLDVERGVVETGINALRLMQVNPGMLALLIQEAQSQSEMTSGETTMSERQWMLRAQFEQFMQMNSDMPSSVLAWPFQNLRFAIMLRHWQGSLSWGSMAATGGIPSSLANYALRAISRRPHQTWTQEYIQGRILGLAHDTGVGGIIFQPVAEQE